MRTGAIDVEDVISETPINGFRITIFLLCFAVMMLDGFDTQSVAYIAPTLSVEWNVGPNILGMFFASALLGAMIGALTLGFVADRLGRRVTLALCVAFFGLFNLATAYATSVPSFLAFRFLCGLGLGGAIPNVLALVTEFAPARRRVSLAALTWCGFALGAVFGGLISIQLLSKFGWPSVFIFGGVLPILLAPVLLFVLPESIKFLVVAKNSRDKLVSVLNKVDPARTYRTDDNYVLSEINPGRGNISALFKNGLAVGSICLCLAFFMSLLLVYCFINWIPLLLRQAGLPLQDALLGTVMFNLAGILGSLAFTRLIDINKAREIPILIGLYVLGAIAVASIGFMGSGFAPVMTAIFMSGFFVIGVQVALAAVIANYYPTAIRGTGIGWSQVVGRTGSLIGPLVGGGLVAQGVSPSQLFQLGSIAPILACACLAVFMWWSGSGSSQHRGVTNKEVGFG